jgi:hypothetical protein
VVSAGTFQTSQWSHTLPAGSIASGSSTISASDSASSGTPAMDSGGFTSSAV